MVERTIAANEELAKSYSVHATIVRRDDGTSARPRSLGITPGSRTTWVARRRVGTRMPPWSGCPCPRIERHAGGGCRFTVYGRFRLGPVETRRCRIDIA